MALQNCVGFCQTSTWISPSYAYLPHLFFWILFFKFTFYWRIIALQNFAVFCQTSKVNFFKNEVDHDVYSAQNPLLNFRIKTLTTNAIL